MTISDTLSRHDDLRSRAVAQLTDPGSQARAPADATAALGVIYGLASSPSTAPDALALLHELQVHQVEVELQAEELRRSRVELERSLHRHIQLFDHAPTGILTVDGNAVLGDVNRTGARLLGIQRDELRGQSLEKLLTATGVSALRALLGRVTKGGPTEFADLQLRGEEGEPRCVHASACLDPAGGGFLISLMGAA